MARMSGSVARTRSSSTPTTILKSSYSSAWRAPSHGISFCQASLFSFQSPSFGVSFFLKFPSSPSLGDSTNLSLLAISGVFLFPDFGFWVFLHLVFWLSGSLPFFSASSGASCLASAFVSAFFQKDAPRRLGSPLGIHETARHRFLLESFFECQLRIRRKTWLICNDVVQVVA